MTPGVYKVETVNGVRWRGGNGDRLTDARVDFPRLLDMMAQSYVNHYWHREIHLYSHKSVSLALPLELI